MIDIRFRDDRDRQEASGFVQALNLQPYDQTTRLVFADWLEERGYDDEAAIQRRWTEADHTEALATLEGFAYSCEISVAVLIEGVLSDDLTLDHVGPDEVPREVWDAVELLIGRPIADSHWKHFYISCSC